MHEKKASPQLCTTRFITGLRSLRGRECVWDVGWGRGLVAMVASMEGWRSGSLVSNTDRLVNY